jgi:hypothetical protein
VPLEGGTPQAAPDRERTMNDYEMTLISRDRINQLRAEADRSRLAADGRDQQARPSRSAQASPLFKGLLSLARILRRSAV